MTKSGPARSPYRVGSNFLKIKRGENVAADKTDNIERRKLIKTVGAAAIAGVAINSAQVNAQSSGMGTAFVPQKHAEDAWMGDLAGGHRVFIDTSTPQGGIDALRYASNILNAHINAYAGAEEDYAMIVCYRHASTPFAYSDEAWRKYGAIFSGIMNYTNAEGGTSFDGNPLKTPDASFPGMTVEDMASRGIRYAICASATNFIASMVANNTGSSREAVLEELRADTIRNSRFVPAGVMAATRAQEYGYSLLYSAG